MSFNIQVRNAVEKERQSLEQEKERVKRVTDDENEKHERIVKQMTEQLDIEKERHSQTKDILNKLKQVGKFLVYFQSYLKLVVTNMN